MLNYLSSVFENICNRGISSCTDHSFVSEETKFLQDIGLASKWGVDSDSVFWA